MSERTTEPFPVMGTKEPFVIWILEWPKQGVQVENKCEKLVIWSLALESIIHDEKLDLRCKAIEIWPFDSDKLHQ